MAQRQIGRIDHSRDLEKDIMETYRNAMISMVSGDTIRKMSKSTYKKHLLAISESGKEIGKLSSTLPTVMGSRDRKGIFV
jgi:hypothetical protein